MTRLTGLVAAAVSYQVVIHAFASYLAWFWLLTRYPASHLHAYTFWTPLFGVLAGWLLLGDPVTPALVLAMACVALGIYLVNRQPVAAGGTPRGLESGRPTPEVEAKGAALAARPRPAVLLADADQERVELVEERGVVRQVGHEERLDAGVVGVRRHQAVAGEDPSRVGVHDEDRPPGGVERDGVGRLRPDARDAAELGSQGRQGQGEEPPEMPPVPARHVAREHAEPPRLHAERAGRAEERGQPGRRQGEDGGEREGAAPARSRAMARSAFRQAAFCVRIAPTTTSNRERAGHQR